MLIRGTHTNAQCNRETGNQLGVVACAVDVKPPAQETSLVTCPLAMLEHPRFHRALTDPSRPAAPTYHRSQPLLEDGGTCLEVAGALELATGEIGLLEEVQGFGDALKLLVQIKLFELGVVTSVVVVVVAFLSVIYVIVLRLIT